MRYIHLLLCCFVIGGSSLAKANLILAYGDSLTAPYGMDPQQSWVHLTQERIDERTFPFKMINGGISGATTHTGLAQLPRALAIHKPTIVIIGLGSNDGRLGLSTDEMKDNLKKMVELSIEKSARVLLVGFKLPVNYGPAYREPFENVFKEVAEETNVPLVPFMLKGIALRDGYMLEDRLHPNAKAQPIIFQNIWPHLEPIIVELIANERGSSKSKKSTQRIIQTQPLEDSNQ